MIVVPWVLAMALVLGILAATLIPARGHALLERFTREAGLPPGEHLQPTLQRRLLLRERLRILGGLLGLLLNGALAVALTSAGTLDVFGAGWLLTGGMVGGFCLGVAAAGLLPTAISPDSPRVARPRAVSADDYVSPIEQTASRALAVACGVLAILSLAAQLISGGLSTGLWLTAVVTGALAAVFHVVAEIAGGMLVPRGGPARSEAELAWEDALRAANLRDLLSVPTIFGIQAIPAGVLTLGEALAPAAFAAVLAPMIIGVLLVGAIVALVIGVRDDPARHYLRRLWPELAARREAALYGAGLPVSDTATPTAAPEGSAR